VKDVEFLESKVNNNNLGNKKTILCNQYRGRLMACIGLFARWVRLTTKYACWESSSCWCKSSKSCSFNKTRLDL